MKQHLKLSAAITLVLLFTNTAWGAKNVILMIADGGGYNQWLAASMYQGRVGRQVYDQSGWLHLSCTTYRLNHESMPTGNMQQLQSLVYDPAKAWSNQPTADKKFQPFEGYMFLTTTAADSAATASTLATGQKTFYGSINWSSESRSLQGKTIAELSKKHGKSVGIVTSVQFSDATPACLGGVHNMARKNIQESARELLESKTVDVLMGCGDPDYNANGRPIPPNKERDYCWVGGKEMWSELKQGKRPWKLIQTKAEFESLASGPTPPKVLGVPPVSPTLQKARKQKIDNVKGGASETAARKRVEPFTVPLNDNVPSLADMTRAALNCLDDNPQGFFLMVEGGAIDWSNHGFNYDRVIEEQIDFTKAVEEVVAWIEKNGGWENNLLILTADHESGLLFGPNSDKIPFDPLVDNGPGRLPEMRFNSGQHTNSLVPLYARGSGSQSFLKFVSGCDEHAAKMWKCSGKYIDNTAVFEVMKLEVTGSDAK